MKYVLLGIESSCDETAAAVYTTDNRLLSNVIYSQTDLHKQFGGVVPEIASRAHIEKISHIVASALEQANISLRQVDVIAVTNKPGLPGSLLTGVCFAKGLAYGQNKKIIGVNHLEGHGFSSFLEHNVPFPHLCLTASGGHTSLYLVKDFGDYDIIGITKDDAAGEAFDKIAKLIQLPYPGGPYIEKLAAEVDFIDFFKYSRLKDKNLNFSFSGLKTAVLYNLVSQGAYDLSEKSFLKPDDYTLKQQVASSLLVCITDIFEQRLKLALQQYPEVQAITFVGGVACNKYIKARIETLAHSYHKQFFSPSAQFCTDNAAMIAFVGHYKAQQNKFSDYALDIY
ncbi:MAG: tRNA (adenosine(37)-N6)-threonylcarbamoyltransferase complex transferase subunit TsaD [Candidatus Babeliaceae bacterium]|jgi:N6-L-threonylcarbamoyladenine synthase